MARRALLLDRDGILNREVGYVWELERFAVQPEAIRLCRDAQKAGYGVGIITNQGGIAKGLYSESHLSVLHEHLSEAFSCEGLPLPLLLYCPHHPEQHRCLCRKPERLWLERALARLQANPAVSWMVGDNPRDLIPARALGMATCFVGSPLPQDPPDLHLASLAEGMPQLYKRLGLPQAL